MSIIWIVNILSVFFLCVCFAGIVIPQILLIAFRRRLFDEPDERKIHHCVVPRLGGMAFKPVVFFSFILLLALNVSTGHDELLKENYEPIVVPDTDMERFTYAVSNSESPRYYLPEEITPRMYGRRIRIVGGNLDGYEGCLLTMRGSKV